VFRYIFKIGDYIFKIGERC